MSSWLCFLCCLLFNRLAPGAGRDAGAPSDAATGSISVGEVFRPHSRVVSVHDSAATEAFEPRLDRLRTMVERGLTLLTSKPTVAEAWRSLLSSNDVVGIKVHSPPGPRSGTRPQVVQALIEGMIAAGLPPTNIIVWDKNSDDLRRAGFYELEQRHGIRVMAAADAGYDEQAFYETPLLGQLVWGDREFGQKGEGVARKSYVSRLVSRQMTKIINVTPLLNHYRAGVTGNLYGLALGSVDNTMRFESDAGRLAQAVPEIYALQELSDRVVLNVTDALICQYQGEHLSLLHYSAQLNELRFSFDPVALDVLSIQELARQAIGTALPLTTPRLGIGATNRFELYSNASLLELGMSDPANIRLERTSLSAGN